MRFALIPVKELERAKARLAPALDAAGRRDLVVALFRDVLDAALACRALDGVTVVTRDAEILAMASAVGAEGLATATPSAGSGQGPSAGSGQGLNEELTEAARELTERGAERIVVLAADLPLVSPEAIAAVAEVDAEVALVPSLDGGTNALALTPYAITFRFGPQSAQRHLEAAAAAGLTTQPLELPTLVLDVDLPEDLERLRAAMDEGRTAGQHTLGALERLGLVRPPVREGR